MDSNDYELSPVNSYEGQVQPDRFREIQDALYNIEEAVGPKADSPAPSETHSSLPSQPSVYGPEVTPLPSQADTPKQVTNPPQETIVDPENRQPRVVAAELLVNQAYVNAPKSVIKFDEAA